MLSNKGVMEIVRVEYKKPTKPFLLHPGRLRESGFVDQ
jgi:hypothetical protein